MATLFNSDKKNIDEISSMFFYLEDKSNLKMYFTSLTFSNLNSQRMQ